MGYTFHSVPGMLTVAACKVYVVNLTYGARGREGASDKAWLISREGRGDNNKQPHQQFHDAGPFNNGAVFQKRPQARRIDEIA